MILADKVPARGMIFLRDAGGSAIAPAEIRNRGCGETIESGLHAVSIYRSLTYDSRG